MCFLIRLHICVLVSACLPAAGYSPLLAGGRNGCGGSGLDEAAAVSSNPLESFSWVWHINSTKFGQDMATVADGFDDEATILVIPHVVFAGCFVLSRSEAVPFGKYIMGLYAPRVLAHPKRGKTAAAALTSDIAAKIRDEYPWFTDEDIASAFKKPASQSDHRTPGASGSGCGRREVSVVVPLAEDAVADAVAELRAHRDQWQWDEQEEVHHFYVQARGGASTKARCGKAADCVATFARSHVRPWCRSYGCNVIRSFAFSTHISEHICHVLAREWCAKQNYYYQAWLDAGQLDNFDFSSVDAFPLSDAFFAAFGDVPATSATFSRFLEGSTWVPTARGEAV